jgi:predicted DNA-binding transcriptional regulator AlpA
MPNQPPTEPNIPRQRTAEPRTRHRSERDELLPLTEVYRQLDVSRSTFYDWRAKGKAPHCIKLPNGELRIRRSEFERWLATLEEEVA